MYGNLAGKLPLPRRSSRSKNRAPKNWAPEGESQALALSACRQN